MALISGTGGGLSAVEAVAFDLPDLHPVEIVARMTPAGRDTLHQVAHSEAEAIREAARAEGFAAGRAEGIAALESAGAALAAAATEIATLRDNVADEVEAAAVDFGLRIAEHALAGALSVDRERVVDVVRGALRRLVERERVTILVHPDDLDLVRDSVPELITQLGGIEHCEVQSERRVAQGGAVVRTVEGEVDATLATKLERARAAVAASIDELRAGRGSDDGADDLGI